METNLLTVDVSVLEGLREIEPALVGQVIDVFIESASRDLAKIAQAVAQKCASDLSSMAHGLKSAAASVGAMAVSHYCFELEKMGRSGVVASGEGDKLLKALQESFQAALSELQKHKN
jgi:HPt (histidine-containing phosphotransfer) domain-containing protein